MDSELRQLKRRAASGLIEDIAAYYAALVRLNVVPFEYWLSLSATDSPVAVALGMRSPVTSTKNAIDPLPFIGRELAKGRITKDLYDYTLVCIQLLLDTWKNKGPYDLRIPTWGGEGPIQACLNYLKTIDPSDIPPRTIPSRIGVGPYPVEVETSPTVDIYSSSYHQIPRFVTILLDTMAFHHSRDPQRHTPSIHGVACPGVVELFLLVICLKLWYEITGNMTDIGMAIQDAELAIIEIFWDVSHLLDSDGGLLPDDLTLPSANIPVELSLRILADEGQQSTTCNMFFERLGLSWDVFLQAEIIEDVNTGIKFVSQENGFDSSESGRLMRALEQRESSERVRNTVEAFLLGKINSFGV